MNTEQIREQMRIARQAFRSLEVHLAELAAGVQPSETLTAIAERLRQQATLGEGR